MLPKPEAIGSRHKRTACAALLLLFNEEGFTVSNKTSRARHAGSMPPGPGCHNNSHRQRGSEHLWMPRKIGHYL